MRIEVAVASALLGMAPLARAQRLGFTHQMLPAHIDPARAVAFGDVEGDGDLDAFVGMFGGYHRLYFNDGTGVFADAGPASLPAVFDATMAVEFGDADGDGDLDAIVGNSGQDRLLLNGGAGVFTDATATNLPVLGDFTTSVALGDVDGDGDLDAFLGTSAPGSIGGQNRLLLNAGTGAFADVTATNVPALLGFTTSVALGDVDVDGDLDAFLGTSPPGSFGGQSRLYLNGGAGAFADATATNVPALLDFTQSVALGDVDVDGDLDAFVGNGPGGPIAIGEQDRLYLNGGTGVFADATASSLPAILDATKAVALGDVDGDGDLDALVGNYGQSGLLRNGGAGTFADVTATNLPALSLLTEAVALGDVDGDGDLDALVGNMAQVSHLHLNDGSGVFTDVAATNLPALISLNEDVSLGDVDGDGDLDAILADYPQARLLLNDGTGVLTDATGTNVPFLPDVAISVALGDVDGDGDLDALVGDSGGLDRLYLNGGTGAFTDVTATNLPPPPIIAGNTTPAAELADVDGDGDLDAFLGNNGALNRLYRNGGTGVFTDVTLANLPILVGYTLAVAFGDVDGDGDLDAYLGNGAYGTTVGQPNRLWLNGGTGAFTDVTSTSLPALLEDTEGVAFGDVDGDGDLDAFEGSQTVPFGGVNRLLLNTGTGVFTDATATNLPPPLSLTRDVALGDMDGDGDLDAYLGTVAQERLYVNDGAGLFTDVTGTDLPVLLDDSHAVALGDMDGDGDRDAFVVNRNGDEDRLYTNLTRQLAWRGIPRAGKPLTLDLRGPAIGTWLLATSVGTANIPLPPFGTLRLSPATLFIVAGGPLDPQGLASLTFPVPANPALVGASLYWQAVVGPPLRFTNLEVTTVTNL